MLNQATYTINSLNKISGTDESFSCEIKLDQGKKWDRCCVLGASIPKSYYLVQSGSNTFQMTEKAAADPSPIGVTLSVSPGNYSASSFGAVVASLMTTNSPKGITYSVAVPSSNKQANTGKFTFTSSGVGITCSIVIGSYLYDQFGFSQNSTNSWLSTSGSLTSLNVVNFQLENTLFVHSDLCSNGQSDVLCEIFSSSTPDYGAIQFQCPHPPSWSRTLTTQKSNVYHFSITDENGNLMKLNGQNVVLTILCYKEDNIMSKYAQIMIKQMASV